MLVWAFFNPSGKQQWALVYWTWPRPFFRETGANSIAGTEICEVCPGLGILQPQWKTAVSAGLLDSTSVFCQGDLGSNPVAGTEICEVCPGLGILQPQWNPTSPNPASYWDNHYTSMSGPQYGWAICCVTWGWKVQGWKVRGGNVLQAIREWTFQPRTFQVGYPIYYFEHWSKKNNFFIPPTKTINKSFFEHYKINDCWEFLQEIVDIFWEGH